MSGRYARLNDEWILRGWQHAPWMAINWRSGERRKLSQKIFYVADACDGLTDLNSFAFLPVHHSILDRLVAEGIVEECNHGKGISRHQKFRSANNPQLLSLEWSITGLCNLRCRHCYIEAPSGKFGELSFNEILHLIDQFEQANVLEISLTGGEPFLRKDWFKIMVELTNRMIRVSKIFSNGLLISDEVIKRIKSIGILPSFQISFDGCGSHDYMRGRKGSESKAIASILSLRNAEIPVVIATSIDKVNIVNLSETYELLKALGIQYWHLSVPQKIGNWRETTTALSIKQEADEYLRILERWLSDGRPFNIHLGGFFRGKGPGDDFEIEEHIERFTPESYDCLICRQQPYLLPDGTLIPCPGYVDTALQRYMPNILKEDLSKVWSQSIIRNIVDIKKKDVLCFNESCRVCHLFEKCGIGCRAAALTSSGILMDKDPVRCEIMNKGFTERFRKHVTLLR